MSNLDQLIERYQQFFIKKLGRDDVDVVLLRQIAQSLGPTIYQNDGSKVACRDSLELDRIKSSFLIDTLDMKDDPALDLAIEEVCVTMGMATRNKYRVVFYYLLVEKFKKQKFYALPTAAKKMKSESSKQDIEETAEAEDTNQSGSENLSASIKKRIHNYSLYAAGAGLIPIPVIDLASISTIQYLMTKKIASNYPHVKFDEAKAKSLILALLGGAGSLQIGTLTRWLVRGIPFLGPVIGGTAISGFAYLTTRLIGNIFNDHFASGGDLTVEDATFQKMKDIFQDGMKRKAQKG